MPEATVVSANPRFKEVNRLAKEQKLNDALIEAQSILKEARAASDERLITESLLVITQLQIGLSGFETAVRTLRAEAWPKADVDRVLLHLYYGAALLSYQRSYSYEIVQREKTGEIAKADLREWTRDQIDEEILRNFEEALKFQRVLAQPAPAFYRPYLSPNSYPVGIRPVLRDAVTYLAIEQLGDATFWSAEQTSQVYQLPLTALARGESAPAKAALSDRTTHPLLRIASLLNGLHLFHRSEPGAALEARYELIRRLHSAASQERDKASIRETLQSFQKGNESVEWWSVGQGLLSEFFQAESSSPNRNIQAMAASQSGAERHPKSYGASVCRSQIERLRTPSLSQNMMASDAAAKPSMLLNYRNINKMYFRAYAWDLPGRLETKSSQQLWQPDDGNDTAKLIAGQYGPPIATWSQDLPATTDFLSHRAFVSPPLKEPGAYQIVGSMTPDFKSEPSLRTLGHMIVTDLVVERVRQSPGALELRVLNGSTGAAIKGVEVRSYSYAWNGPHKLQARKTTGADGRVTFEPSDIKEKSQPHVQLASFGEGRARQIAFVEDSTWLGSSVEKPETFGDAFLFTDRSVFRPEQKIFWKTLVYSGSTDEGKFKVSKGVDVEVVLYDANSQQVALAKAKTNEFGSAVGEFTIPAGRALGTWRLETHAKNSPASFRGYNAASVTVEEYKRPTFEANFQDSGALRLNKKTSLKGEARYYFGLPVAGGRAAWRVTRTPVYSWWWWGPRGSEASEVVAAGLSAVAPDGTFPVEFTPKADEREATSGYGLSYLFDVKASVTDEGGETREASKTIQLGFVSRTAEISPDRGFFMARQNLTIPVRLTNLAGEGVAGRLSWRLVKVQQPSTTPLPASLPLNLGASSKSDAKSLTTPGDQLRARWETGVSNEALMQTWGEGAEVAKGESTHPTGGAAKIELKGGVEPGLYRLVLEGKDDFGAMFKVSRELTVLGSSGVQISLPLLAVSEKTSYAVGETARVFVNSGWKDQPVQVDCYRSGRLLKRQMVSGEAILEFPIKEADRGGFTITARTLRDYQALQQEVNVLVPWTNQELNISLSTFRDRIRPGATETFRVTVSAKEGEKLPSKAVEVLAYMYDRSLDLFQAHLPARPIGLFPSRTSAPGVSFSLGSQVARLYSSVPTGSYVPTLSIDQLHFPNSYGVGGPGQRGSRGGIGIMMSARAKISSLADAPGSADLAGGNFAENAESKQVAQTAAPDGPAKAKADSAAPAPAPVLRSDFSETAFWKPQLLNGADGTVSFEFKVPDSLTSWNLWVHGITKDMRSGSVTGETRSVKDLMVRPYVSRFLREGDAAEIKVSVNNASATELNGDLTFDIENIDTGKSALNEFGLQAKDAKRSFKAPASASDTLTFKIKAPVNVQSYAFKVTAQAKDLSDGEVRLVPVLPSRVHLAQSRFVTLKNSDSKTMEFKDLAASTDKTLINERLVVSVDAQLFYGVLKSLPYLVTYPYECSEQTLNRFLSTGIVSSVFKKYPSVEKMARDWSTGALKRDTQLEKFDTADANQRMTFEESPWLQESKGGEQKGLVNVLDPKLAAKERDRSLARLQKMQLASGGFPWFESGPASEYITLYLLIGFARAHEFQVDVPKDMITRAWTYLRAYKDGPLKDCMAHGHCESLVTMLNFALSSYPDLSWTAGQFTEADEKEMLDYSFARWKSHSPLLKGYLAMTLQRAKRFDDAKLVWSSVMDSAKSTPELGTYWAPEERSWLWYNDTVETQAFALRVQMELAPKDAKNDGLVQWLFLNKKLNHWKSTRATAEAIYSLVHFLDKTSALGKREEVTVETAGQTKKFEFEPDVYTGAKNQIVIPGSEMQPATASKIVVTKQGAGFAFASSTWHFSTDRLPVSGDGDFFSVARRYFKREVQGSAFVLKPLNEGDRVNIGDQVEVQLSLKTKHEAEYVHLRDPRGSGFEPESQVSGYHFDLGLAYYEEIRDSGANFFFNWLPVGEYTFKYRVRANMAGVFRVGPATVQSLYAPEFNAYSAGQILTVVP